MKRHRVRHLPAAHWWRRQRISRDDEAMRVVDLERAVRGPISIGLDRGSRRDGCLNGWHLHEITAGRETWKPVLAPIVCHRERARGELIAPVDANPHERAHENACHRLAGLVAHAAGNYAGLPDR